jgi:hypothetical protein
MRIPLRTSIATSADRFWKWRNKIAETDATPGAAPAKAEAEFKEAARV